MSNSCATDRRRFSRHDFVETEDGLIFAVVEGGESFGRALCFLRYVRVGSSGPLKKLDTRAANAYLSELYPEYLYHCPFRDTTLHGVPLERITRQYEPRQRAAELASRDATEVISSRCGRLVRELSRRGVSQANIGVTGSLLVGAANATSDMDLVIYGPASFQAARNARRAGVKDGTFAELSDDLWEASWRRRGCPLTLDEYVWHERRKHNKAVFEETKFDIAQGADPKSKLPTLGDVRKLDAATISAHVIDDSAAFEFPARWQIDHPDITELLAFTPTYTGQAFTGEMIEAAGIVEQLANGQKRLVVGASREAPNQWIKVLNSH